MLTSSALYKRVIHEPHEPVWEVDLYDGDGVTLLENDVPVFGGAITANVTHRVTRQGMFGLGPEFWPGDSASAALTPYRTIVRIKAGVRYGDGSKEVFDIFKGRVGEVGLDDDGQVQADVQDQAADVIAFQFEQPRNSENVTVLRQIERLITEALPSAVFGTHDVPDAPTPKLTWDEDRGKALDDLAETLGGRWYALGNGDFVVRAYPYDVGTPVQSVEDGDGGLLTTSRPRITSEDAANSVTVMVERFDGGTPFRVTARDTSPTSPTQFGGPFGRRTRIVKVQTPLTNGQALQYARAQLSASTALSSQWQVGMVADYTLEPGDTIALRRRGNGSRPDVRSTQLIDSITYPLELAPMTLSTRAFVRAPGTVES